MELTSTKYGARVYFHNDGTVEVCQTVLKNNRYVIDTKSDEKFVKAGDDRGLVAAVRAAGKGRL